MDNKKYEVFGKYILLEKLAAGGMAEVFLSRSPGAGGIGKFVAIKRILPQFYDAQEFIDMFKDEAKIAINLSHSNVVSIYEFGVEKNQFFLVMDYVEGRNLRQILNKMKKTNSTFSIDQIIYICKEVAAGLDHAHRCLDGTTGKPLNITHRDMSPQNIMISYEGEVKIVDFGIAKAESQLETTRAGTLKGKFGYMSPEQAEGQPVDLRTDIFSLGICLWELLANDRLFIANNEINTLRKIRDCQIPSLRKINPNIHVELERVVQKALARDRNLRYQTAAAMHRDLNRYLNRQFPDFSPHDFSVFIKTLFADEILEIRRHLIEYARIHFTSLEVQQPLENSQSINANTQKRITPGATSNHQTAPGPRLQNLPAGEKSHQEPSASQSHANNPSSFLDKNTLTGSSTTFDNDPGSSITHDRREETNTKPPPPFSPHVQSSSEEKAISEIMSSQQQQDQKNFESDPSVAHDSYQPSAIVPESMEEVKLTASSSSSYRNEYSFHKNLPKDHSSSLRHKAFNVLIAGAAVVFLYSFSAKLFTHQMLPVINILDPHLHFLHAALKIDRQQMNMASRDSSLASNSSAGGELKGNNGINSESPPAPPVVSPNSEGETERNGTGGSVNNNPSSSSGLNAVSMTDLLITSTPSGAEIYLNGNSLGKVTPSKVKVPSNEKFTVLLRRSGYIDYEKRNVLKSELGIRLTTTLQKALIGYLNIDVIPPRAAKIYINGQKLSGEMLPIFNYAVPAETWIVLKAEDPVSLTSAEEKVMLTRDQRKSVTLYLKKKSRSRK